MNQRKVSPNLEQARRLEREINSHPHTWYIKRNHPVDANDVLFKIHGSRKRLVVSTEAETIRSISEDMRDQYFYYQLCRARGKAGLQNEILFMKKSGLTRYQLKAVKDGGPFVNFLAFALAVGATVSVVHVADIIGCDLAKSVGDRPALCPAMCRTRVIDGECRHHKAIKLYWIEDIYRGLRRLYGDKGPEIIKRKMGVSLEYIWKSNSLHAFVKASRIARLYPEIFNETSTCGRYLLPKVAAVNARVYWTGHRIVKSNSVGSDRWRRGFEAMTDASNYSDNLDMILKLAIDEGFIPTRYLVDCIARKDRRCNDTDCIHNKPAGHTDYRVCGKHQAKA